MLVWFLWATGTFVFPQPAHLHKADAVVVLGGASNERLPVAKKLIEQGWAHRLLLSATGTRGNAAADRLCSHPAELPVNTTCFRPRPLNTRGEAEAIGDLARAKHWKTVIVVTSRYHQARADTVISQCTDARVIMDGSNPHMSPIRLFARMVYESFGLLDAHVQPQCQKAPPDSVPRKAELQQ